MTKNTFLRILCTIVIAIGVSGFKIPEMPNYTLYTSAQDKAIIRVQELMPDYLDLYAVYLPSDEQISNTRLIKKYIIVYMLPLRANKTMLDTLELSPQWDINQYLFKSNQNPQSTYIVKNREIKNLGEHFDPENNRFLTASLVNYQLSHQGKMLNYSRIVGATLLHTGLSVLSSKVPQLAFVMYSDYHDQNDYRAVLRTLDQIRDKTYEANHIKEEHEKHVAKIHKRDPVEWLQDNVYWFFFATLGFMMIRFFTCYHFKTKNKDDAFHSGFTVFNLTKLIFYPKGKITRLNFVEGTFYTLMLSAGVIIYAFHLFEIMPDTYKAVFMIPIFGWLLFGLPFLFIALFALWGLSCLAIKRLNDIGYAIDPGYAIALYIGYFFIAFIAFLTLPIIFVLLNALVLIFILFLALCPKLRGKA